MNKQKINTEKNYKDGKENGLFKGWYDNGQLWVEGNYKDEKKIQYLNQSDAYILPSYNEGLPISILEAMTYKLPIISTNVGGIPEVLKDKVNGLLIEPGSKKELKDALEFVINNTSEFKKFGENSLQFVKPHLPEKVKKELSSFYCSL